MRYFSLRTKLILSFSIVILVGVFLSAIVGMRLIGNTIIQQAQDKVRLDLNSAREVYKEENENIKDIVRLTAVRFFVKDAISRNNIGRLQTELQNIRESEALDVLNLTDEQGRVLVRARRPDLFGDQCDNDILRYVLSNEKGTVSTQIIPQEQLQKEGGDLADQARIKLIPTPKAKPRAEVEETSGMMITAAAPVYGYDGDLIGVLLGGKLLNRNYEIVDRAKGIVYRGETYKGKDIGTATIFQGDLRISTNVLREDGSRAIGTRVSQEVYDQVIGEGLPWIGRAFVVNDWYITAYEPIMNLKGDIIGMLYVGMLEAPYVDLRNRVLFIFLGIAFLSVILLSVIAYFTTTKVVKPLKELSSATDKVARGHLEYRLPIQSHDEIGQLAASFNRMTEELQKATEGYQMLTRTLEDKIKEKTEELRAAQDQLVQSEKLASLGKLAAGIAHEVNNPLTSILINSHLIAEKLKNDTQCKDNLELITDETARCSAIVKGLLEFSRQTQPEKKLTDVNKVVEKTLLLLSSEALAHKVKIEKDLDLTLPEIMIDGNKIEQVFTNVILNALEAMPAGGDLFISSKILAENHFVALDFRDSGCGICKENIGKIFDPFFTTKEKTGTGLGLSVSYGIVQQHGGRIEVQSEVEKGTTVSILLPVSDTKAMNSQNREVKNGKQGENSGRG
jgi:two-component system NtrC family sensor kinase